MPISFMQPFSDRELYEVYLAGSLVGLVWEAGGHWCADPSSTADPLVISAPTRQEAAEALLHDPDAQDGSPEEKAVRDLSHD